MRFAIKKKKKTLKEERPMDDTCQGDLSAAFLTYTLIESLGEVLNHKLLAERERRKKSVIFGVFS